MGIHSILENRDKLEINQFIQNGKTLYDYYEKLDKNVVLEFISIGIASLSDKEYQNLTGRLSTDDILVIMRKNAEKHLKARLGKQAFTQIIVSVVIGFLSFLFLYQVVSINRYLAIIASLIILILVILLFMKSTSIRLIKNSDSLYKEKVDKSLMDYFHHYLA